MYLQNKFTGVDGLCVEFWYFMYGRDIGSLNIYWLTGGGAEQELVWTKHGTHGPQWRYGQVDYEIVSQVFFEMLHCVITATQRHSSFIGQKIDTFVKLLVL